MNVAVEPPDEANIGVGIDKNLEIHQAAQSRIAEDQYSLENDDRPWLDMSNLGFTGMGLVVIDGLLNCFAGLQRLDVVDQKVDIERVRMIEIDMMAQVDGHIAQIAIIGVLLQIDHARGTDRLYDSMGDGSFSGSGSSSDSDHHNLWLHGLWLHGFQPNRKVFNL